MGTVLDFMAENSVYPMCSRNGKIFLKSARKGMLTDKMSADIISQLQIKTRADCRRVRRKVTALARSRRETHPIKLWIKEERPREMLIKSGPEALPHSKLLAIILRTGRQGANAEEIAKRLLNRFGSLRAIDSAEVSEICKIEGIGPAKGAQIKAAFELGKRLMKESAEKKRRVTSAEDVVKYVSELLGPYLRDARKESFHVVLLDTRNKPIYTFETSKGTVNASLVDPKDVIREATLKSATSVILVHNHPSGEVDPSEEDVEMTARMAKVCKLVGLRLLDHVIIGKNKGDYFSFAAEGLIKS